MNDFRSNLSRRAQQRAIDGILGGPSNSRQRISASRAFGHPKAAPTPPPRRVDNFKRPEGYHAAPRAAQTVTASKPVGMPGLGTARADGFRQATPPVAPKQKLGRKRPHAKKRRSSWLRWSVRGGVVVMALLVLMGGFLFTKGYIKLHKVFRGGGKAAALQANVNPTLLKGEGDGRINILLLGKGGPGHDGPDLTDTMLLASIDPIGKTASLISVPRDLWVTVPGYGSSKINAVYANAKYHAQSLNAKDTQGAEKAGISQAENTVGQVLGVPIHYYGMIDFQAFEQAIDTVGGVDITVSPNDVVSEHMWDESTHRPYYLNVAAGQQHFDGQRALFYARSRHTSARGDFDRTERQRLIIQALMAKILTAGTFTNPAKVSGLMSAFGDHVSTDMSISDSLRLRTIASGIKGKIDSVDLADPAAPMVKSGSYNGLSIVEPTAGLSDFSQLNAFVRNKLRDGYLASENATVAVLNGTNTAGLASQKANELKSYGYTTGTVGDAPTHTYQKTVLVDLSKGKDKYTKHYLENRLHVTAVTKLPDASIQPGGASFVVILGQDAQ